MPRLFHQPPKYRLHKSTKQAVVSFFGEVIQLGPYGSARSHKRYQELIGEWYAHRHAQLQDGHQQKQLTEDEKLVASITTQPMVANDIQIVSWWFVLTYSLFLFVKRLH